MAFLDWWVPEVALEPGEAERWSALANQKRGWRAIGGILSATERRVIFRPNRVDRRFGGTVWTVPLTEVAAIGRRGPTFHPFDGGLRSRLQIMTRDGAEHLFVINKLAAQIAVLRGLHPSG